MSSVHDQIAQDIAANDVVLYMKGTPVFPQCGFSAMTVQILSNLGVKFKAVDVLQDALDELVDILLLVPEQRQAEVLGVEGIGGRAEGAVVELGVQAEGGAVLVGGDLDGPTALEAHTEPADDRAVLEHERQLVGDAGHERGSERALDDEAAARVDVADDNALPGDVERRVLTDVARAASELGVEADAPEIAGIGGRLREVGFRRSEEP